MKIYRDLEQGSDEWLQARCGIITASIIGKILTSTGKAAKNDHSRRVVSDLLAQRITGLADPSMSSRTLERGHEDEMEAKLKYSQEIAPVEEVGFITEDFGGVIIGYSPDGLVGDDGLIECKSRLSGLQLRTIISLEVPSEYMAQIQTGLMVTGRKWLDFISYPAMGGGKMMVMRVYPDPEFQAVLLDAAREAETEIRRQHAEYENAIKSNKARFFDTERREELEIIL
ncbi:MULTISPECIES: lambda exonuclease family protein [Asaia]|uniref:YqaJ viral recombinase domain-containing protein n=1 Tax=Asaia bogorensis TaxID=91915 RepID=A0A060QEN4_9PROT|nr:MULTISPECIES: lambda exonuclease family protein [Asaia]ETC99717.1 exonuclease [Asaia sp. SF2.1]CDG39594.1 hypothetical protein ASAP_1549 [Asaia bogorensis]